YRDSTYFMFYSGDNCCGDAAHYAVMVARASDPMGPFQTVGELDGTARSAILEANPIWNAPGHNSIVTDESGNDWIFYHAINRAQPRRETGVPGVVWDRRVMLMDPLVYLSGWPRVLRNEPGAGPMPSPVVNVDP